MLNSGTKVIAVFCVYSAEKLLHSELHQTRSFNSKSVSLRDNKNYNKLSQFTFIPVTQLKICYKDSHCKKKITTKVDGL